MKYKWIKGSLLFVVSWVISLSYSWGGQVVSEESREWARAALKEEKVIQTLKGKNTLAVLYFKNKTGNSELNPLQKGLSLMLMTDLSAVEGLQVVERVRLQALTEEMGLGASGVVDPGTAPRVGKMLGAEWLVGGSILSGKPPLIRLKSILLDVPSSSISGQQFSQGELSDLFRLEKDILFAIIKVLKIELTPDQEAALKRPCSTSSRALLSFFMGIDESDRGNYDQAAVSYENALRSDPDICGAGEALQELRMLGLVSVTKRSSGLLRALKDSTSLTDQLTTEDIQKRKDRPKDTPVPVTINIDFR